MNDSLFLDDSQESSESIVTFDIVFWAEWLVPVLAMSRHVASHVGAPVRKTQEERSSEGNRES